MSASLQLASLALEVIKLAVDNDMNPFVLVPDWLIAAREVNDAQPRMTEADAAPRNRTTSTPNAAPRQVGATKKQPYVGWWRNAPRGEQAARAPLALVRSLGTRATD